METELKSLADLPDMGTVQAPEQNNQQEQNQQQIPQEQRPVSKYAAKQQQRRRALTEQGPREQHQHNQQRHDVRRSAALEDTEKWMAIVRMATSLDQISAKVENLDNRLNALVLPETPAVDVEALRKNLWEDAAKQANCTVNLITVRMEEQAQDLRQRLLAIQTQITDAENGVYERINTRLIELFTDVVDTRELIRELTRRIGDPVNTSIAQRLKDTRADVASLFREVLQRIGDPADTDISQRLRQIQYLVIQKEHEENAPQDRKHWLARWACQLLFGSDEVHVTEHGVWTEVHIGDKTDFGGSSLLELWKKIRAAKKAYKVQQKIAALQEQLNKNTAAK